MSADDRARQLAAQAIKDATLSGAELTEEEVEALRKFWRASLPVSRFLGEEKLTDD